MGEVALPSTMEKKQPLPCWKTIGINGDRSCPTLERVNHCHNCSVYRAAGRELLMRQIPSDYAEEWTTLLAKNWQPALSVDVKGKKQQKNRHHSSVIIFRLAEEWFALPVWVLKEVTPLCPIHTVPHRSNHVFSGIVNIRGEILMCITLENLLGVSRPDYVASSAVPSAQQLPSNPVVYRRTVVIEVQDNRWAFRVDEIAGIDRLNQQNLQDVPVVIAKTPDTYTQKILFWEDKKVNYLNYELLFYELLFYTLNRPTF